MHTPDDEARKDYIGNAARDGRVAVVFARLLTHGEDHGVHALVVPLRDESGRTCPGIRIEDCGHKGGLNGVDNGRIWFDQVRVPRDALLDRYGSVAEDGTYSSPIESRSQRFFTMLGALVRGRVSVGGAAGVVGQVGAGDRPRLRRDADAVPAPRTTSPRSPSSTTSPTSASCCRGWRPRTPCTSRRPTLTADLHEVQTGGTDDDARQRELESRAAGLKAVSTWHATATIQACREACGGAGYLSANRLTQLKADSDVFTTFEGDNTVLLQLVAKAMLTDYRDHFGELDTRGTVRFLADQVVESMLERTGARGIVDRLAGIATPAPPGARTRTTRAPAGCGTARGRRRCSPGGRSTSSPAWRAGSAGRQGRRRSGLRSGEPCPGRTCCAPPRPTCTGSSSRPSPRPSPTAATSRPRGSSARSATSTSLADVEADRGWFLEHGRLTPATSKAVTRAVDDLCRELRPHVGTLVAGLGIPACWLGAEITDRPTDTSPAARMAG